MRHLDPIRLAFILFALFVGSVVYAADAGIGKPFFDAIRSQPLGDKISHFFLMGTLATLANRAFGRRSVRSGWLAAGIGTLVVLTVVVAEEISQIWIPGRTFELYDLAADFLGIACGEWIGRRWTPAPSAECKTSVEA